MPRLRRGLDRLVGVLCDLVLGIFFRRIEVVGRHRVPDSGPLVVVANHVNGLIDPMFVLGPLDLPARLLGKSTLWKIPVLKQILDLAGVVPVFRPTDPGVDPAKNAETFARCHEELARGGRIAIFPEGTSHDDPKMKPLRTGAARIALEAERRFGPLDVHILPIGLVFEERTRFRSRALVVVGEPIAAAAELAAAGGDEPRAARELTARIADALDRVTLNYDSWEDARLIELGADLWDRDHSDLPRARRLAVEFEVRRALADGLERLRQHDPLSVAAAVGAARDYERLLRSAGITDEQVVARYRLLPATAFAARTLLRLVVAAPVAALGFLLNGAPWVAVDLIARRVRHEPNQIATYKVFPSLLIFPAAWTLQALAAWRWLDAASAIAIALVAPFAGWVAVRWHERREALWRDARAFVLLARGRGLAGELRARRILVEEEIEKLVERWRALQEPPGRGEPPTEPAPEAGSSSESSRA